MADFLGSGFARRERSTGSAIAPLPQSRDLTPGRGNKSYADAWISPDPHGTRDITKLCETVDKVEAGFVTTYHYVFPNNGN